MTIETQASPLAALQSIGIISADQHRRALADPDAAELQRLSELADHMVWLIGHDIVSSEDLRRAWAHVTTNYNGDERVRYEEILKQTVETMKRAKRSISEASMSTLRDMALLTSDEHDLLLPRLPPDFCLSTPAVAFAWIELNGQLSSERMLQIRRAMTDGGAECQNILREVETVEQKHKSAVRGFWRGIATGPRLMSMGALLLLAAVLYILHIVAPPSGCADPEITNGLHNMMLRARIDAVIAAPSLAGAGMPTLVDPKEVGYASETRVRGCLATLKSGDTERPYAYTIERGGIGGGNRVTGASTAIVKARFGHLDANGKFINNAAPIGRDKAESVFRSSFEQQVGGPPSSSPEDKPGKLPQFATPAAERTRAIAEIEPVAPCREIKAGLVYSCRLLVEYNDPLMLVLTQSSIELQGDFTFQREKESSPWTMSQAFGAEFSEILAKSSLEAVRQ